MKLRRLDLGFFWGSIFLIASVFLLVFYVFSLRPFFQSSRSLRYDLKEKKQLLAHLNKEPRSESSPHKKHDSIPGDFDYIKWVVWFDRVDQSRGMHLEDLKYPPPPLSKDDGVGRYAFVKLQASFSSSAQAWIHASHVWCDAPDLAWVQRFVWASKDAYPGGSVNLVLRVLVLRRSFLK